MISCRSDRTGRVLCPAARHAVTCLLMIAGAFQSSFPADGLGTNQSIGAFLAPPSAFKPMMKPYSLDRSLLLIARRANAPSAESVSSLTRGTETVLSVEKIKKILPHRFPFLLVDKVVHFEPGKEAIGVKQVSMNEDQFNGHFPQRAVMPGVLQVEALAQLAGIIALQEPVSDGKGDFFFAGVDGVKWKRPVVPGDTLVMEASLLSWKPKFGIAKMAGRAYVDGQLALDVKEMTFALVR